MVVPIDAGGNGLTDCILVVPPVGRKGPEGEDGVASGSMSRCRARKG